MTRAHQNQLRALEIITLLTPPKPGQSNESNHTRTRAAVVSGWPDGNLRLISIILRLIYISGFALWQSLQANYKPFSPDNKAGFSPEQPEQVRCVQNEESQAWFTLVVRKNLRSNR